MNSVTHWLTPVHPVGDSVHGRQRQEQASIARRGRDQRALAQQVVDGRLGVHDARTMTETQAGFQPSRRARSRGASR
jgi:hypothetical protein